MNKLQRSHHPQIVSVLGRINESPKGTERRVSTKSLDFVSAHRELDDALRNLNQLEDRPTNSGIPDDELQQAIQSFKDFKDSLPSVQSTNLDVADVYPRKSFAAPIRNVCHDEFHSISK